MQERLSAIRSADRAAGAIQSEVPAPAAAFLEEQLFLVLAVRDQGGAVWVTLLTGPAGFARAPHSDIVEVAALPVLGDPARRALRGPALVGLLAIEPSTRRRMRFNGLARPAALPGGSGLRIELHQVYANCPKYIQQREPSLRRRGKPGAAIVGKALSEEQQHWLRHADTLFIGTADPSGNADASHRGGTPGFVEVVSPGRIRFPDYAGNSMYMTLGNIEVHPAAGLLLIDWSAGATLQLSGAAHVDYDRQATPGVPGALRIVDFSVLATVQLPNRLSLAWTPPIPSRFN